MRSERKNALLRALCGVLLLALLLSVCGAVLFADHVCDDPCCVICRFAELRRQLIWAALCVIAAAFGLACFRLSGIRRSATRRCFFTLVSFAVQLND